MNTKFLSLLAISLVASSAQVTATNHVLSDEHDFVMVPGAGFATNRVIDDLTLYNQTKLIDLRAQADAFIDSKIPTGISRTAFNELATKDVIEFKGRKWTRSNELTTEDFAKLIPSGLAIASNAYKSLNVDRKEIVDANTLRLTYAYKGSALTGWKTFRFAVETKLDDDADFDQYCSFKSKIQKHNERLEKLQKAENFGVEKPVDHEKLNTYFTEDDIDLMMQPLINHRENYGLALNSLKLMFDNYGSSELARNKYFAFAWNFFEYDSMLTERVNHIGDSIARAERNTKQYLETGRGIPSKRESLSAGNLFNLKANESMLNKHFKTNIQAFEKWMINPSSVSDEMATLFEGQLVD